MASTKTPAAERPLLSNIKKSILLFIQGLVPYWVYRDIQFLLSPCCTNTATITIVCAGVGLYNVTVTFSSPLDLPEGYLSFGWHLGSITPTPFNFSGSSYTWYNVSGLSAGSGVTNIFFVSIATSTPAATLAAATGGTGYPSIGYTFPATPYVIPSCK